MSIKKSQSSVWFYAGLKERNHVLWHLELFSARRPVKVFKTLNDRQSYIPSTFRLTRDSLVSQIISICEIYGEYRTEGHLVSSFENLNRQSS